MSYEHVVHCTVYLQDINDYAVVNEVYARWPSAGFHRRLVQLSLARLRTHPWSPLPMLRL